MKFATLLLIAGALMATAMPTDVEGNALMSRRADLNLAVESSSSIISTSDRQGDSADEKAITILRRNHGDKCFWSKCGRGCQNKEFYGAFKKQCGFLNFQETWFCCPNAHKN
ncbi:hypothetical protein FPQ18DRAFT_307852 [Pyronema domesticum]|uniref:Uncharacterized protein n=1 Tax=Pyronema omphalodes (strain CBS 100304) TaxID=1076935 RepID=U4LPD3_PYROM|nr:hypothetical protein FPQ18DRAFT_307852 [Pyronema domesticum]CCX33437.1 Protein of unknown function [Pyronema omphalodes CBS 100304]